MRPKRATILGDPPCPDRPAPMIADRTRATTNKSGTIVDCNGVMNNDLIRLGGRPRVKPLDRPNLRPKETKHNG
jgi:hypothetical protein